ncbi:MAG: sulfatase-like hydrolase/transferase, partial [Oscillospiraceae bacterium]|nr:sulfatase-like hydrolase/transferase [Oscillospiraceae bacterium]
FSDQQRHDTIGAYSKHAKDMGITPNLDKMAENGVKFEYAFTPQPVCGPARACIMTGRFATQNGCFTNGRALKENEQTIAKILSAAGYDTAYIGKWHLASNNSHAIDKDRQTHYGTTGVPENLRGGFRYWRASDILEFTSRGYGGYIHDNDMNKIEFKDYRCDCITDFGLEYIANEDNNARDEEKPFFMFISHIEPHHQNDRDRYEGPDGSLEKFGNFKLPGDLKNARETEPDFDDHFANYLGCCNSLDYNLGRIIAELKQKNIFEDTIIIYTSDHSCHFRTRNDEYKRSCHENSIRIPMIIYGGEFKGGLEIKNHLVSLIDLPATILDSAGVSVPNDFMGKSLVNILDGDFEWENEIYTQISENKIARSIRTAKWKYAVMSPENPWAASGADKYYEEFLYDLENDPYEENNLIKNNKFDEERKALSKILIKHMNRAGEKTPVITTAE